jgi:hypothetical protein
MPLLNALKWCKGATHGRRRVRRTRQRDNSIGDTASALANLMRARRRAFVLSPGHDARVIGSEPCVVIDFTGFHDDAQPS